MIHNVGLPTMEIKPEPTFSQDIEVRTPPTTLSITRQHTRNQLSGTELYTNQTRNGRLQSVVSDALVIRANNQTEPLVISVAIH